MKLKSKNLKVKTIIALYTLTFTLYTPYASAQAPDPIDLGKDFGFRDITTLGEGTTRLVPAIFSIATVLVVIYFLIAAFKYMKAGANKEDIESAKQMIIHSLIGFILLMLSFLILQFLLARLFGITGLRLIG